MSTYHAKMVTGRSGKVLYIKLDSGRILAITHEPSMDIDGVLRLISAEHNERRGEWGEPGA